MLPVLSRLVLLDEDEALAQPAALLLLARLKAAAGTGRLRIRYTTHRPRPIDSHDRRYHQHHHRLPKGRPLLDHFQDDDDEDDE